MIVYGIRQGNKVCLKYLIQFITLLYLERLNDALLQYTYELFRKDHHYVASLYRL